MTTQRFALGLAGLLGLLASTGCATPKIVEAPQTTLGSIVIYKNGVAYFERYADPKDKTLTLRVPVDRVDDFLKSLSIVDEKTGEPFPISYPTAQNHGDYVDMTIPLPDAPGRLKITYVTESPSWKPSYRIVLDDGGKARLQGWAVVDNTSGEDWKGIRVGVGSTSALSFRYDLHSVRLVERETLTSGEQLALAPPSGGTPYAVATRKVRVLGNIGAGDLAALDGRPIALETTVAAGADSADEGDDHGGGKKAGKVDVAKNRAGLDDHWFDNVRAQAGQHRIRVEGFAQTGDGDPGQASLERANKVKEKLVAMGVPDGNIDVVATGQFNREAVRVLATEQEVAGGEVGESVAPRETQPVGEAHFLSDGPMTLERDHSAMVSMVNAVTNGSRVFFYDPVSSRGSKRFAFNAVRLENPSRFTLDAGPFTVYAKGQFLGEGLSEPILPGATAFIPYALDRSVVVDPEVESREEIERLRTIQRGVVTTESRRIKKSTIKLANRGQSAAEVYVRHKVGPGFVLTEESERLRTTAEKLGGAHLFRVEVPAGGAVDLVIEEWSPLMKTVDIRTDGGVESIGLFLRKKTVDPKLAAQIEAILKSHREAANLEERISMLAEQMQVYRERVDEINVQLMTLSKVGQAAKLRQNLQGKMQTISEKLQATTMETTELEGNLMTLRIALQDKLAELSFEEPKAKTLAAK